QAPSVRSRLQGRAGRRTLAGGPDDAPPGETEGGPDSRHRGADQWLFVVSGTGDDFLGEGRAPPLSCLVDPLPQIPGRLIIEGLYPVRDFLIPKHPLAAD